MTSPNFNVYQPPGVYVTEAPSPLVSVIGVAPTVVAIVGPAIGYRTQTDVLTLAGTVASPLTQLGADSATVVVTSLTGTVYAATTDYVVDTIGSGTSAQLTVERAASGSTITDGQQVFVGYRYTDATYTSVKRFTRFEDVKDQYGQPIDLNTNAIISPLTLAAQVAFVNGANMLVCVATSDPASAATRAGIAAALVELNSAYDVNVVVVLPVGIVGVPLTPGDIPNILSDLKAHCETAYTNGLYRIGIVGFSQGNTVLPDVSAIACKDHRVVLAWPYAMSYFNGYNNQTFTVDGCYLAAAYAGVLAGYPAQMPLTRKQVVGFSGIPATVFSLMTKTYKDQLSAAGVAVTEITRAGTLVVRHGVTTDNSSTQAREISLVRQKDGLIESVSDTLDTSGIIGTPIDATTVLRVKGLVQGALQAATDGGTINGFTGLSVRQTTADPTVIEVKFAYLPAYPLNYISVIFSIDTTTGSVTPITTTP